MMRRALSAVLCGLLAAGAVAAQAPTPAWRTADPAYRLAWPRDHASHPDYALEWWYYTGTLWTSAGRRFGYQLTFFRVGVDPSPANPSRWAVRDLFLAHLAITDVEAGTHRAAERMNRAGVGWAGADTLRYRVWNEDWLATTDARGDHVLTARTREIAIDLALAPGKRPVPHGVEGYSRKGASPGNASMYYSLTRMPTQGRLRVGHDVFDVTGLSWMDHEFGTSVLEAGQLGWDWFSLQFEDGTELMLFQMRRGDGTRDPQSSGTWVAASGQSTPIDSDDLRLAPGRTWRSPGSGATYPVAWTIELPRRDMVVEVSAVLPAQEVRAVRSARVTYWEGAVDARATVGGRVVRGHGYLEMTGYVGQSMSEVLRSR